MIEQDSVDFSNTRNHTMLSVMLYCIHVLHVQYILDVLVDGSPRNDLNMGKRERAWYCSIRAEERERRVEQQLKV